MRPDLEQWLRENVRCYPTCQCVELSSFAWPDPNKFEGTFQAMLDDVGGAETFSFFADGVGETKFVPPIFGSPLGVPASFAAIEMPEASEKAIGRGLAQAIPRLQPYGLNRSSGVHIDVRTPLIQRLTAPLEEVRRRVLDADFRVRVSTATLEVRILSWR